ncbi:MerR family transcriptional regulator [Umezawaea beigongshangensis]|uniref:MerR family transcriptional regulator n=1 Tax=Umezawaea beigongshangensis TaxID=2780383 RepID=UPI0018F1571F|nr:MerR family transcriptional regulator [Umezawaea beigongshangensis]
MRIGDAAAAAGTTPRALRFYEQRGLLPPSWRTTSGQREYEPEDVARVRIVREMLALGLTVEDVAALAEGLHVFEGDALPEQEVPEHARTPAAADVFGNRLAALDAEIARLTRLRERIATCHAQLATAPTPD